MQRYGFQRARGDNLTFRIEADPAGLERLRRLTDRVRRRGRVQVRSADLGRWDEEVDRVLHLLEVSLAHLPDHPGWQRESLESLLAPLREVVDPELVLSAEAEGETAGFLPGLPNLNEAFRRANGLRYPWDYGQLWWAVRRTPECLTLKSVLVPPEHWRCGVTLELFDEMVQRAVARGYRWADLSLTSDDNPNLPQVLEVLGARVYKRYRVYRRAVDGG